MKDKQLTELVREIGRSERLAGVLFVIWLAAILTACDGLSEYPRQWWVCSGYQTDLSNVVAGPFITEIECQGAATTMNLSRRTGSYNCQKH